MLRVTIELAPHGDETAASVIGECTIVNDRSHPDRPRMGNYRVALREGGRVCGARVEDFPRELQGPWYLLHRVLDQLAPLPELTIATECCGHHGERCGYCFACPDLPGAATLGEANRLIAPCDEGAVPAPLPAEDAGEVARLRKAVEQARLLVSGCVATWQDMVDELAQCDPKSYALPDQFATDHALRRAEIALRAALSVGAASGAADAEVRKGIASGNDAGDQ